MNEQQVSFCSRCGSKLHPEAAFCENCGNAVATPKTNVFGKAKEFVLNNQKAVVIGGAVFLLVMVVAIVGCLFGGGESREEVAENYVKALLGNNHEQAATYLPYDADDMIDHINDYRGLVVTARAVRSYEIGEYQVKQLLNAVDETWSREGFEAMDRIDEDKIKEAYQVEVSASVYEVSDDEHWPARTFTYTLIKYKGKWKVLTDFIYDKNRMFKVW